MAIGDRILIETFGTCILCFESDYRIPAPEIHKENETAWQCSRCEGVYYDRAIFETSLKDSEFFF